MLGNHQRLEQFMEAYARNLAAAREEFPADYAWPASEFATVLGRMRGAVERLSFNKDGHAFKRTCKDLGIKYTYSAIKSFLRCA